MAQSTIVISGTILDGRTELPLADVAIHLEGTPFSTPTGKTGDFYLEVPLRGEFILHISKPDFSTQRLPVSLTKEAMFLGTIQLERDITIDKTDNLITLTDDDIAEDEGVSISSGLLQATRDVFLNRAAFDFGQAFFRVRGYDSQYGKVLLNGIAMNKFFDGRPQWNNWGGLNDVTRNQEFSSGLLPSDHTFGGLLGATNINTRPSGFRPGTRVSTSASNRTYAGRLMATYNSGLKDKGWAYSVSASRRWATQGYIDGTLYDAYSFFGALEYQFNASNSLSLTSILAANRRGRSSAITEEVYDLVGRKYNPYWGTQDGKIRNSRERNMVEPVVMLNHFYKSDNFSLNTGIAYQFGTNARSRLGYFNAPNPDPTYYRYLPSYYINSPIGANFISANLAKEGFLASPQWNWDNLYVANTNGKAAYVFYDDVTDDTQLSINSIGNLGISDAVQADFGGSYKTLSSANYAEIQDLLGADFHEDIDPFSNTLNDVHGQVNKGNDAIFSYNYEMEVQAMDAFAQVRFTHNTWDGFVAGNYSITTYRRNGLFQNERFPTSSLGNSEALDFTNFGVKGGLTYKLNGRQWINWNGAYLGSPPVLQNVFINPRENNQPVPHIQSEKVSTTDLNYYLRLPKLMARFTGFYTRFQHTTDINFFFVDAGVGSDFVQEVVTNLDKLHLGLELGLEYQVSSSVKLTAVAAVAKYLFASDPSVTINFDTAGAEEDLINPDGNIDLGIAKIKDLKLAQGPQRAFSLGIEYRDPKYWWIGMTTNYMADNYANISTITRTASFYLDPETGQPFPEATEENVKKLLRQQPLENFYLLNVVGGKSWLKKGTYISVFASINNVFDTIFRTGGYEQSRNGNFGQLQQDNLSGTPSFAPKYWYGYGRTYFLNLAYSF
jgi:hypothetical protein